jgi:hypothetical protein
MKQVKDSVTALGAERQPQQGASVDEGSLSEPEPDPMEGCEAIYASEILDDKTCAKCAEHDEHEYASMSEARADYPEDGYKDCVSPAGCRGTLVLMYDN